MSKNMKTNRKNTRLKKISYNSKKSLLFHYFVAVVVADSTRSTQPKKMMTTSDYRDPCMPKGANPNSCCGQSSDIEMVSKVVAYNTTVRSAREFLLNSLVGTPPEFTKPGTSWQLEPIFAGYIKSVWKEFTERLVTSILMYGLAIVVLLSHPVLGIEPVVLEFECHEVTFEMNPKSNKYDYTVKRQGKKVSNAIVIPMDKYRPEHKEGWLRSPYAALIPAVNGWMRQVALAQQAEDCSVRSPIYLQPSMPKGNVMQTALEQTPTGGRHGGGRKGADKGVTPPLPGTEFNLAGAINAHGLQRALMTEGSSYVLGKIMDTLESPARAVDGEGNCPKPFVVLQPGLEFAGHSDRAPYVPKLDEAIKRLESAISEAFGIPRLFFSEGDTSKFAIDTKIAREKLHLTVNSWRLFLVNTLEDIWSMAYGEAEASMYALYQTPPTKITLPSCTTISEYEYMVEHEIIDQKTYSQQVGHLMGYDQKSTSASAAALANTHLWNAASLTKMWVVKEPETAPSGAVSVHGSKKRKHSVESNGAKKKKKQKTTADKDDTKKKDDTLLTSPASAA
jgi:hypothetical protein